MSIWWSTAGTGLSALVSALALPAVRASATGVPVATHGGYSRHGQRRNEGKHHKVNYLHRR